MKIYTCILVAACATTAAAAPVDLLGREQGRLSAMPQKSFEDLRDLTERRIADIRATTNMSFTVTSSYFFGTNTRYVSAAGNDSNDGQTPETAWKTINKVNSGLGWNVKQVLFRRGDVFRGTLKAAANVTYSAYGEGPKPCIYASPANGADPSKWERVADAANVWRYNAGTVDVGTIVFDGGREHAIKIVHVYHTNGVEFTQQYTGLAFTNSYKDLAFDLHFWHDYTKSTRYKKYAKGDGYLYMYSKGDQNPGSRFRSMEFNVRTHGIRVDGGVNNVHIDNLCIKYAGAHGISADTVSGLKVTNCEFGWIGGGIQGEYINNRNFPVRFGNAIEIYGGCDNYVVDNCYIYQVYDAGITQQGGSDNSLTNIVYQKHMRYSNNVIENCNYSIEYFLSKVIVGNPSRMEDFQIFGNIMWDAGTGLCEQRPDLKQAAHIKSWASSCNRATGYVISDNVFARSKAMLIEVNSGLLNPDGSDSMPTMSGNLFIGAKGQNFGAVNQGTAVYLPYDNQGVGRLCERYANNYFLTEPKRKYSLSVVPPGPHVEQ